MCLQSSFVGSSALWLRCMLSQNWSLAMFRYGVFSFIYLSSNWQVAIYSDKVPVINWRAWRSVSIVLNWPLTESCSARWVFSTRRDDERCFSTYLPSITCSLNHCHFQVVVLGAEEFIFLRAGYEKMQSQSNSPTNQDFTHKSHPT